jgi:uncharacterized Zn finger protein
MLRAPSASQRLKASRYLWQGRVQIHAAGPHGCLATVRGSDTYTVTLEGGQWDCTCPLKQHRPSWACTHIAATWLWWQCRYANERECNDGEPQRTEAATVRP